MGAASVLQVIMLSSVPELHSYIDKSQLTEDLGGTLDYCHTRWLCHHTVSPLGRPHAGWAVRLPNPDLVPNSFCMTMLLFPETCSQ